MTTDASSLLRLGHAPARLVLAVIVGSVLVFAIPALGAVKSPWPAIVALVLFVIGALIMAQSHPDPFPLGRAWLVLGISVAVTVLVDWDLPDTGWAGYGTWNFGAVNWLFFFLTFRGRVLLGWLGLALMSAITIYWAVSVGRSYLDGVDLVVRHAGTLLMGTLFGMLFRRAAERITAFQQEQVAQAAAEVAALTELREREVQAGQLNTEARDVLERIASGDYLDPAGQRGFELLEASLRDTLRGGGLKSPAVAAAARAARLRGAAVVLLDDRNDPLDAASAPVVESAVLAELATLEAGSVTVRLLPPGRDAVASIVRNDGRRRRRIDIPVAMPGPHG
ncbi:hypothetical protein BH11ACT4_BH11ACT4_25090 [soil metagenome]